MKKLTILISALCLSFAVTSSLSAQNHADKHNRGSRPKSQVRPTQNSRPGNIQHYSKNKVVVVNHRNGRSVTMLPAGHNKIVYKGRNYFYHAGYFYHHTGKKYWVIRPPFGIRIHVLPVGYHTVYFGTVPYYYYRGIYYHPVENEFETVEPDSGTVVPELPEDDVEKVTIDGKTYYKYDDVLYKQIVTDSGIQYQVVGKIDDDN